jgi:large subunit ribosomal protein L22
VAKWVRLSPRKARLVAKHISGRSVPEARTVLAFTQRAAAREIEKVLRSAVANAEANHGLIGDNLIVSAAYVDEGPVMKRWRARARGRVARIKRPTCHITVKLVPGAEGVVASPRPAPAAAAVPATPAEETAPAEVEPEAELETAEELEAEAEAPAEPEASDEPEQQPEPEAQAETEKTEETED